MPKYLKLLEENGLHPLSKDRGIRPDGIYKSFLYNTNLYFLNQQKS